MLAISLLIRPLRLFLISDEDLQTKSVLFPSLPQPAKSQRGGSALLPKQRSLILILSPSRIKLIWTTIWPIHDAPNMENGLLLGWVRGRLRAGQESMTTKPADRVTNSFARVTHLMDPGLNYSSSSTHIYQHHLYKFILYNLLAYNILGSPQNHFIRILLQGNIMPSPKKMDCRKSVQC